MMARSLLGLGDGTGMAAAIAARLRVAGGYEAAGAGEPVAAILIDAMAQGARVPFLDLSDADFTAQVVDATLACRALFVEALSRVAEGGAILIVTSDAYLGQWYATGQAAGSATLIGMMRSIAMEQARRGVRVNALALPATADPGDTSLIDDAGRLAAALLESGAVSGQCVVADGGGNLMMRQARRR